MKEFPEKISTDTVAGQWRSYLDGYGRDEMTEALIHMIIEHPESARWIREELEQSTSSESGGNTIDQAADGIQKEQFDHLWKELQELRGWSEMARKNRGLSELDDLIRCRDGWKFADDIWNCWNIDLESVRILLKEIIRLQQENALQWGDILSDAAYNLMAYEDRIELFWKMVNRGEIEGEFVDDLGESLKSIDFSDDEES